MNLTKGKISKLYSKKKQSLKRNKNKRGHSGKSKTFRKNRKVNLARKSLKRLHFKANKGGGLNDGVGTVNKVELPKETSDNKPVDENIENSTSKAEPSPFKFPPESSPVGDQTPPVVNETLAPVNETPAPSVNEFSPPVNETPSPSVNEFSPVVNETPSPSVDLTPAPIDLTPSPSVDVTPVNVTPAPIDLTPSPSVNVTPAPIDLTPSPSVNEFSPVNVTPSPPIDLTPAPIVDETPAPSVNGFSPAPSVNEFSPVVNETPSPSVDPSIDVTPSSPSVDESANNDDPELASAINNVVSLITEKVTKQVNANSSDAAQNGFEEIDDTARIMGSNGGGKKSRSKPKKSRNNKTRRKNKNRRIA